MCCAFFYHYTGSHASRSSTPSCMEWICPKSASYVKVLFLVKEGKTLFVIIHLTNVFMCLNVDMWEVSSVTSSASSLWLHDVAWARLFRLMIFFTGEWITKVLTVGNVFVFVTMDERQEAVFLCAKIFRSITTDSGFRTNVCQSPYRCYYFYRDDWLLIKH